MPRSPKYDVSGLIEAQHEPGSRGRVLRNKLGIKSKREMERAEHASLIKAISIVPGIFGKSHRFKARDIRRIHQIWLGDIYDWAGRYREVNISKDGFPFAASANIPRLMDELEKGLLAEYTPCLFKAVDEVARAIATVHVELVLIHPFREGNGRLARLFADLMAMQADLPPLNYRNLDKDKRNYIEAIHSGDKDCVPMTELFLDVIRQTLTKGR